MSLGSLSGRRFNILVGTISMRENKVLVLQRSMREKFMPGAWGLPCGKIDFGEDLHAAARRELKEESGLEGDVQRIVGYSQFFSTKDGIELHNLQVNFLVFAREGDVLLDDSNQAAKWVSISDLDESGLDEFTVSTIRQAC